MKLNRDLLTQASHQNIITEEQAQALWTFLKEASQDTPGFRFTHILYYLGGMLAIGAMTLFMTLGWESFGGWGLLFIALAYAVAGLWLTEYLLYGKRLPIPAGITATFVLVLTPLAIYGLQNGLGLWAEGRFYRDLHRWIDWRWLIMELGTLAVGVILLWRYRLAFLVMPIAVTLWYMSMDLVPFLFNDLDYNWELRKLTSIWFGLLMTLLAFWIDIRTSSRQDFAFWLYLFGVITFWSGMTLLSSDSELNKFVYFCINLGMILIGAVLSRRVFVVFGALGAATYLGHLAYNVFQDSILFPFILTMIGLGIIWLGILWQRHEERINHRIQNLLPKRLQMLLARRH